MRKLLTALLALSMLGATFTTASATHLDSRYLAQNHRLERKALADLFEARRDAARCAHRESMAAIHAARKNAACLSWRERSEAFRELDRRRSAQVNAHHFTMREINADYRAELSRLTDGYRAALLSLRDAPSRRVAVGYAVPAAPLPQVRVERHIHVDEIAPPCGPPAGRVAPPAHHAPVDVPRLIGGILDIYLSVR